MAVGLLPVVIDIPSGTYTLSMEYGGTKEDLVLNVVNEGKKTSSVEISQMVIDSYMTDAAVSAFDAQAAELMAEGEDTRYFSGSFLEGITGTLRRGFGREIYLNSQTWATMLGIETLHLRMERHCENALKVAQFMESHPAVEKVEYPALPSSPYYPLAQK